MIDLTKRCGALTLEGVIKILQGQVGLDPECAVAVLGEPLVFYKNSEGLADPDKLQLGPITIMNLPEDKKVGSH